MSLQPKDYQQQQLFRVRLTKNARHLRRWPKRGITCYRLYERDIPEIPLVVDRYEDYLHLSEFERPHDRSPDRHRSWLELMRLAAAEAVQVPQAHAFLKSRVLDQDQLQYEKIASIGQLIPVSEGGLRFYLNLTDYVDTGLFLDHRITRSMVRDEAEGKDFLNLFAYTGSFSVYAANGGAKSTTTVDLSKNYLSWAENNFRLNGLLGHQHQFIPSDALEFLRGAQSQAARFDLAVIDPPTYSRSKKTENDWDVQRNHVELLQQTASLMKPGGVIYFSTNYRRFRLEESQLDMFQWREISNQTVPPDFRNRRIHRCWRMVKAPKRV